MFKNKNILITGASAGLGEALAHSIAKRGGNLTLCARRADKLLALRDKLLKSYTDIDILCIEGDVSKKDNCQDIIQKSLAHFGQLDCLIANAGKSMWCSFKDVSDPDELDELMKVNYMGVVYMAYYALPYLRKSRGSFVAISSILGTIPLLYHTGYVAAKYALNGFIETLRLEEPGVHFLLALPSWISGTEIREKALSSHAHGAIKVKKSYSPSVINSSDCAELIIKALIAKKTELYVPKIYAVVPVLRQMFKKLVDRIISAKVSGQLKH